MLTPNRVVALLTPLVFAPLAGTVAALLASHFPGLDVDADQVQSVFIGGAVIALAPALQWLHGWQKYEARTEGFEHQLALASVQAEGLGAGAAAAGTAAGEAVAAAVIATDLGKQDDAIADDDLGADDIDEDLLADDDDPDDDVLLADDDDLGDLEDDEDDGDDDADLDELDDADELEPAGTRD